VALHDWKTYADMKSLAEEKLGLKLMDNYLPMGSLDQGLDILQIMRNIHIFVNRFAYDMTMQQFIEYRPDRNSKHLNVIKIQSIAASIRQHGLGILNTTVNYTYQFLVKKFDIFSQFLFDEYIRSHLFREYRWYKKFKHSDEVRNVYPYDRAYKFTQDIRKLGISDTGKSFLDQFRMLITEIGNALGYVRMVRSASMYACSEAVKFIPDLDNIMTFEALAGNQSARIGDDEIPGGGFSECTVTAARQLDQVVSNLIKNFSTGNDFFKILVNVFQPVLLSSQHQHLEAFFMIGKISFYLYT
jgi:WASH complex subunit 7